MSDTPDFCGYVPILDRPLSREETTRFWRIWLKMGFTADDKGPYCTAFRQLLEYEIGAHGLMNRSAGTWAPGNHTAEDRAKAFLELEWAAHEGYMVRQRVLDPVFDWRHRLYTLFKGTRFQRLFILSYPILRFRKIIPAYLDRRDRRALDQRIARDRANGKRNPFNGRLV